MTRTLPLICLLAAGCAHHRFDEPEKWAKEFDDPSRDAWQKPVEVIQALELGAEPRIVDLGSGTGYFAIRLAHAFPQGWVYGLDIEPAMTQYLEDRAAREERDNLIAITTPEDHAALPEPVDCVLVVNTYHHIEERVPYFTLLKNGGLLPGGKLVIIDFNQTSVMGPPKEHRLLADQVEAELKQAGFKLVAHHDFLPNQYFMVFQ